MNLPRTVLARLLAAAVLAAGVAPALAGAAPVDDAVAELQRDWAVIRYQTPAAEREKRFEALAARAHRVSESFPGRSEPLVWEGIVVSSLAGEKGGLGALGLVKQARVMYERAIQIDGKALDGSAYNSLGVLYYKVPGWPLGFGDKDKARELLQSSLFYEPLPFVRRVVFIATPHRGSYRAGDRIADLLRKVISLPFAIVSPLQEVVDRSPEAMAKRGIENEVPRSTDNMNPNSGFVRLYSSIPIAPGIIAHSIIAVDNPEDPPEAWSDGVVAYRSAHIEGAASELIVHSGHSVQEAPQAIEEVRRILLEHLREP